MTRHAGKPLLTQRRNGATKTSKYFQSVCYSLETIFHQIFAEINQKAEATSGYPEILS
jgi:hypothetical protein